MRRTIIGLIVGVVLGALVTTGVTTVTGQATEETTWMPDMEKIYLTALGNVFDAAGEKFTDPELKAFYDRLTTDITDSLATPVAFDPGIDELLIEPSPTPVP